MNRVALIALGVLSFTACRERGAPSPDPATTNAPPRLPEFSQSSEEQRARKARSEARLREEGVPIAVTLPVIADKASAKLRSRDAIVDRALALTVVSVKGEGLDQKSVLSFVSELSAMPLFTPKEKAFIEAPAPTKQERAQFVWRYECLGVLHWALGYVEKLERPSKIVDAGLMVKLVRPGAAKYREGAKLRSADEILDEADLIYRYDWACVDARVSGKPAPGGVDCEIVVERHHALNWLYGYQDQAWDDVSTDT